jgi:hypothetical protein
VSVIYHTFAAENPSLPCSSAVFSYPIGASSLYGPVLEVNLTVGVSTVRLGIVTVSVADGAMMKVNVLWKLALLHSGTGIPLIRILGQLNFTQTLILSTGTLFRYRTNLQKSGLHCTHWYTLLLLPHLWVHLNSVHHFKQHQSLRGLQLGRQYTYHWWG